jgi:hypothetical protein
MHFQCTFSAGAVQVQCRCNAAREERQAVNRNCSQSEWQYGMCCRPLCGSARWHSPAQAGHGRRPDQKDLSREHEVGTPVADTHLPAGGDAALAGRPRSAIGWQSSGPPTRPYYARPSSTATRSACPETSSRQFRLPGPPPDDLVGLGFDVARVAASHEDFERVPGRRLGYRVCFGQSAGRRQQRAERVGAVSIRPRSNFASRM